MPEQMKEFFWDIHTTTKDRYAIVKLPKGSLIALMSRCELVEHEEKQPAKIDIIEPVNIVNMMRFLHNKTMNNP